MRDDVRSLVSTSYEDVVRRSRAEPEFHQAVREVLESLERVLARHSALHSHKTIERFCERSGRSSSGSSR